jgi:CheY-specific phosphatase CheX
MTAEQMTTLLSESIDATFQTTFQEIPEIHYFDNFNETEEECVISSIGFTGTIEGSCAICLPDSSACKLVSRMVNQNITEISADIIDGIGEIVNIILGGIKMKLHGTDHDFTISVPSYIKGSRMVILTDIKKTVTINRSYKFKDIVFAISMMYKLKPKEDDAILRKKLAMEKLMKLRK